jgi:hypothetical protein
MRRRRSVVLVPLQETLGEADLAAAINKLSDGMKDFCGDEGDG